MRRPGLGGTFWPTDAEEDLLRVALGLAGAESDCWARLHATLDVAEPTVQEQRLLPLLWRRLDVQGVASPLVTRLRGFYRRSWYTNNLLLAEVSPVVTTLAHSGIEALLLKGAAIGPLYYEDHATRPMSDIDILVRATQARQSVRVLQEEGWTYAATVPSDAAFEWRSRVELVNPRGLLLDLHWDFLADYVVPGAPRPPIDAAWATARPCPSFPDKAGRTAPARALGPEAQLLHAIVHGACWDPAARLQWVADAARMLAVAGPTVDWEAFVALTTAAGRGRLVGDALSYVEASGFAASPEGVAGRLQATSRAASDWLRGRGFPRLLGGLPLRAAAYLDLRAQINGRAPAGAFLRAAWNLEAGESLLAAAPAKVATVVRRARRDR